MTTTDPAESFPIRGRWTAGQTTPRDDFEFAMLPFALQPSELTVGQFLNWLALHTLRVHNTVETFRALEVVGKHGKRAN